MTQTLSTQPQRTAIAEYVEHRFQETGGQARLEGELRALAVDIIGASDPGVAGRTGQDAVQRIARTAVASSVEPLVARFTAELVRGIATLSPEAQQRIIAGGCRKDFRFG